MVREDHFVITVASEIMAILCLADDMDDLKERLGRIIVAYNFEGEPVTADDLQSNRFYGSTVKGCIKAKPDPDLRTHTCYWYMVDHLPISHMAATVYVLQRQH